MENTEKIEEIWPSIYMEGYQIKDIIYLNNSELTREEIIEQYKIENPTFGNYLDELKIQMQILELTHM